MSQWWSLHLATLPFVLVDTVGETDHFPVMLSTEAPRKSLMGPLG